MERSRQIVRVSALGIAANLVLAAFKAAVGFFTGSIAVVLDAVNNLSDALSSVLTIVGARLAARPPDKEHPYGHGRIENVTSVAVAVVILLAGLTSLRESAEKILRPVAADYTPVSLLILAAGVLVKLLLGRYVRRAGVRYNSDALAASGTDALFDAVISLSTLAAALVSLFLHISIEGWLGALISLVILKAGVEILLDSLNGIIGARVDSSLSTALKQQIAAYDGVRGVYDLDLHRYGPEKLLGSVHIEVDESMTAREIHALTRRIAEDVFRSHGIPLTVGIYASNSDDDGRSRQLRQTVEALVAEYPGILELHGFYIDPETGRVSFDLVMDFGADARGICDELRERLAAAYPDRVFDIVLDSDVSD